MTILPIRSASRTSATSAAASSMRFGMLPSDRPCPGRSTATMCARSARPSSCGAQTALESPVPCTRHTAGEPAPAATYAIRTPFTETVRMRDCVISSRGEIVREILIGSDAAARQAQPERLAGEHVDLSAIALEPVRMKVVAHHRGRGLQLCFQPWRRVRKSLLCGGEAVVRRDEGLGKTFRDPAIGVPDFAPQDDQVLGRERARRAEVLLLDLATIWEEADERSALDMVGLRARRAVDRLQLAGDQHLRQRTALRRRAHAGRQRL